MLSLLILSFSPGVFKYSVYGSIIAFSAEQNNESALKSVIISSFWL